MRKYLLIFASAIGFAACEMDPTEDSLKDLNQWPGFYQGSFSAEGEYWELNLDSNGAFLLERWKAKDLRQIESLTDTVVWNEQANRLQLGDKAYQFSLESDALSGLDSYQDLRLIKLSDLDSIEDRKWILASLNGQELSSAGEKKPRLLLNSQIKRLSGYDGCNYLNATYRVNHPDQELYFSPIATTRRFCPEQDSLAQAFQKNLASFDTYLLEQNQLKLLQGQKVIALFKEEQ